MAAQPKGCATILYCQVCLLMTAFLSTAEGNATLGGNIDDPCSLTANFDFLCLLLLPGVRSALFLHILFTALLSDNKVFFSVGAFVA